MPSPGLAVTRACRHQGLPSRRLSSRGLPSPGLPSPGLPSPGLPSPRAGLQRHGSTEARLPPLRRRAGSHRPVRAASSC
ncbi:MAG: hypothetical protein CSA65_05870 [Proteobacteria bacterium]|nr:MAG: hypothetical protein CSA65_05870 [Pseudomonadota bacterium]